MSALKRAARAVWDPVAGRAARSYMVGATVADAAEASDALARIGIASSICYWNAPDDSPRAVADATSAAIEASAAPLPRERQVALKAPALRFDEKLVSAIATRAAGAGVRLMFDSHKIGDAPQTLELAQSARSLGALAGVAVPGRWARSSDDAVRATGLGLRVRVVKGEWEPEAGGGLHPADGFLRVVETLAGTPAPVGVATHDEQVAADALRCLQARGTPCELELLVGLPFERPAAIARALGVPIRLYLPFGYAWPVGLWRVREDPRTAWWVARRGLMRRENYARVTGGMRLWP